MTRITKMLKLPDLSIKHCVNVHISILHLTAFYYYRFILGVLWWADRPGHCSSTFYENDHLQMLGILPGAWKKCKRYCFWIRIRALWCLCCGSMYRWQRDHRKCSVWCTRGDPGRARPRHDGTGFLRQAEKSSGVFDEDLRPHQVQLHAHGFLTAAVRSYSRVFVYHVIPNVLVYRLNVYIMILQLT